MRTVNMVSIIGATACGLHFIANHLKVAKRSTALKIPALLIQKKTKLRQLRRRLHEAIFDPLTPSARCTGR